MLATGSKTTEGLDPSQLERDVAEDLRSRGKQVTADAARESIDALLTGAKAGFADVGEASPYF